MDTTNPTLAPAAQRTLERWHEGVAAADVSRLPEILHPDAVFRSPMAHTPYEGAAAVHLILSTVITIFEDFTYHREFVSEDGRSVALEFSARVGDRSLKGVDLIEIDEPHRGRGYATRAVALVLGEAAHGGVRRVVAEVAIGNPASREVLQRNGFHVVETDGSILVGVDEEPALRYVRELDPTRPPVAGE